MDSKPIPAFYCCYLLRSTVQRAFNYIGSTPHLLRRIKQHNGGISKGGAKRTSRETLKPWEVTLIVRGFPSKIAALQFEWAWQNTHKSRHAAADRSLLEEIDFRVSPRSGKLRTRKPTSRARSLSDRITNLHILLQARSFERWPLSIHIFATDVFSVWKTVDGKMEGNIGEAMEVTLDTNATNHSEKLVKAADSVAKSSFEPVYPLNGVENLDFGYSKWKPHLEKSQAVLSKHNNVCSVCQKKLRKVDGFLCVCPHNGCEAVSHLQCLSSHFLHESVEEDAILPVKGSCPSCSELTKWEDLVRELTLRTRGEKEMKTLFKKPRSKKGDNAAEAAADDTDQEFLLDSEEDIEAQATTQALEDSLLEESSKQPTESMERRPKRTDEDSFVDFEDFEARAGENVDKHRSEKTTRISPSRTSHISKTITQDDDSFIDIEEYGIQKIKQAVEEVIENSPPLSPTKNRRKRSRATVGASISTSPKTTKGRKKKAQGADVAVAQEAEKATKRRKRKDSKPNESGWSDAELLE